MDDSERHCEEKKDSCMSREMPGQAYMWLLFNNIENILFISHCTDMACLYTTVYCYSMQ